MQFICIRHGESEFNAEGRIQGQWDTPLSPLGRAQAEAIAAALAGESIDAIFSSPLQRAYATAKPLAARLGKSIVVDERLQEINAGIFQGQLWSGIETSHPEEARRWLAQEPDFVVPNGESRRQLIQRGWEAFESMRGFPHLCVAVFTHGGLLGAALKGLLGVPEELNPFSFFNGAITRLVWERQWKVRTVNETGHLRAACVEWRDRTGDL